ncbi:hypothetical protein QAD02_011589 [Eretmocerus hayati]|uniref:Uncharacterized protein n=1 Tax=Eretmocerus hayati TaxID=131215 RepID=A0ACC2NX60_9HYME|nr:hypothetical protein QAD02_011589 [Eretmocerus hayati]
MTLKVSLPMSLKLILLLAQFGFFLISGEPVMSRTAYSVKQKYQFVVLIAEKDSMTVEGRRLCTGSLISRNQVLTFSSCLENKELKNLNAFMGSTGQSTDFNMFDILSKKTYDDYLYESELSKNMIPHGIGDIAILKLDMPQTIFEPVAISYDSNSPTFEDEVTFIGWGKTKDTETPPKAHYVTRKVLKKQVCDDKAKIFSPNYRKFSWSNKVFCIVGKPLAHVVDGDFGGPVLFDGNKLVGIAIRPRPIPEAIESIRRQPILVLRLAFYKDFIQKYLHARN